MLNLFAPTRHPPRTLALSARPGLEPLEGRLVPAHIFVHTFIDGPSLPIPASHVAPNLRSAVDHSVAGDEIDLDGGAVYTLFNQLVVTHDLLIRNGAGVVPLIDARHHGRVFEVAGTPGTIPRVTMTGLVITGGTGVDQGGGILNYFGVLTLSRCVLTDNATVLFGSGGGILNYGTLTVNNSLIVGNAAASGGGIFNVGVGTLAVSNSTIGANTAGGRGGGIFNDGTLAVGGSTLAGNTAGVEGGGVFSDGALTVANSTIVGNSGSSGGGLFLARGAMGGGTALLVNDTLSRNLARYGGAGRGGGLALGFLAARPLVWNTLITGNAADASADVNGLVASLGHNLVGNTAGSTGFTAARGDQLDISPALVGLGPLANNGGPTQTMRPASYSRAIDRGDDGVLTNSLALLSTDQRGKPRRLGAHVDIGAYEQ